MHRRRALKWIGTAAALGAAGRHTDVLGPIVHAQTATDWSARLAALPRPAADVAFGNCEGFIGFDMLSLANNHALDLGEAGLLREIEEAKARGFSLAGAGRNLEEATRAGVMTAKGSASDYFRSCVRQRTSSVQMSPPSFAPRPRRPASASSPERV